MNCVKGNGSICHLDNVSCSASIKVERFSFTWSIPNYSSYFVVGQWIDSPMFTLRTNDKRKWHLRLYPKGEKMESKDYVSLFLCSEQEDNSQMWAKYTFYFLINKTNHFVQGTNTFKEFISEDRRGYSQLIKRDEILAHENGFLADDNLTIICKGSVLSSFDGDHEEDVTGEMSVLKDMRFLFESKEFSDITLFLDDKEFAKVHKAILSARSAVFHAMFANDMKEKNENRVNIVDVSPDILEELLRFIYTGKVDDIEKVAEKLLVAADKYDLADLKKICGDKLVENLSIANVTSSLILADLHTVKHLKAAALEFVKHHSVEVAETKEWMSMAQLYPRLMVEAFKAAVAVPTNQQK